MEQKSSAKGISIASLICGILSILSFLVWVLCVVEQSIGTGLTLLAVFGLILGILGIVLGAVGMAKAKKTGESKALAIVGLILGILGTILTFIIIIMGCAACGLAASFLSELS